MNKNKNSVFLTLILILLAALFMTACSASESTDNTAQPDKFSFAGGTGKVGISCIGIKEKDGEAFATIQFDSDAYTYIRVGEKKYDCSHRDGTSYAEIPVKLNANTKIAAETTKMSEAHEIEYEIFIFAEDESSGDPYGLLKTNVLDETAPLIPGIGEGGSEPAESSENYRLFEYDGGVMLYEVKMKEVSEDDTSEPFDYKAYLESAVTPEDAQAKLYTGNVIKYLLAPDGTELPAGIAKETIVVKVPATRIYSGSADITLKDLVSEKYDLVILSADVLSDGGKTFEDFAADAAGLGVPVMADIGNDIEKHVQAIQ